MRFLHGRALTNAIRRACQTKSPIRLAVVYWGQGALSIAKISPKRRNVKILCCLKGGASDPKVIKRFGGRARQKDDLHAKVIWTPGLAIVSSANLSSNGLPEEEGLSGGLLEAGIAIDDPVQLIKIRDWFDRQYQSGMRITPIDLKKAEEARSGKIWGKPKVKRSLIDAISDGGAQEFKQQRISFVLWTEYTSAKENQEARRHLKESADKVENVLKIDRRDFDRLDWFSGWEDLPINTTWRIEADDGADSVTFVLRNGVEGFNYKITSRDLDVIRSAASNLWKAAKGSADGRVIKLVDAAPLLLKHVD